MKKIPCICLTAALTAADQLTKYLAVAFLKGTDGIALIPGVFELYYLENSGAAWGLFKDRRIIFLVLAAALLAGIAWLLRKVPDDRRYRALRILCCVFAAGTAGNAIDRLLYGYVIDFFYISLIDFPIFNVADCFITFSLALALILYRRELFSEEK